MIATSDDGDAGVEKTETPTSEVGEGSKPDPAVAAATSEEEEESPQDSATPQVAPANQVLSSVSFVNPALLIIPPPAVLQSAIPSPTAPSSDVGVGSDEVAAVAGDSSKPGSAAKLVQQKATDSVTAQSPEISPKSDVVGATDSQKKHEATGEEKISASPKSEAGGTDSQPATFTGDSDSSKQGESHAALREDKPHVKPLPLNSAASVAQSDGIVAAKQNVTMNNTAEMEISAGAVVKNMPTAERGLDVPAVRLFSGADSVREVHSDSQVDAAMQSFSAITNLAQNTMTTTNPAGRATDVAVVDRVARAVLEGVVQMRQLGAESISVLLKPDAGTELLLRVEMRHGQLTAQLHFERGNHGVLDQHFDELQRRLAEQGVRLSRGDDSAMGGGNGQFAQSQREPWGESAVTSDEGRVPSGGSHVTRHASRVTPRTSPPASVRGFETWA